MKTIRLVVSLILIPRLFASLLLIPLLLSFLVVYAQVVVTGLFLQIFQQGSEQVEAQVELESDEGGVIRKFVYGSAKKLPPLTICRWIIKEENGKQGEVPPNDSCAPSRLDIAFQTKNPETYDPAPYLSILQGNFERLHLCRSCTPDIIISKENGKLRTDFYSIWGVILGNLIGTYPTVLENRTRLLREVEHIRSLTGERYFHTHGLAEPVLLNDFFITGAIVANLASLVVICLWLALRAHRRVLDYFVRNGALLPMVAACGKGQFYSSIWILTLLRVVFFMGASIPLFSDLFDTYLKGTSTEAFIVQHSSFLMLWIAALVSGLGLATLVASVADLKHRSSFFSFFYRYVPLFICFGGWLVWSLSFIFEGKGIGLLRSFIAALPLAGIGPVLVAPMVSPESGVLFIHLILSMILIIAAARHNSQWFAAHLEDL